MSAPIVIKGGEEINGFTIKCETDAYLLPSGGKTRRVIGHCNHCGKTANMGLFALRNNKQKKCECQTALIKLKLPEQKQYHDLTIISEADRHVSRSGQRKRVMNCECICGKSAKIQLQRLKSGHTKSCGCRTGEKHGMSGHYLIYLYDNVYSRCHNDSQGHYHRYGGRGIKMDESWLGDKMKFVNDIRSSIGERPTKAHSLDRIDNDGDYVIGNLRWATKEQQQNNMSSNLNLTHNGKTQSLAAWSRESGVNYSTLLNRLKIGQSVGEALRM